QLIRVAPLGEVAQQRETWARGHHNCYRRPRRDNKQQVAVPFPAEQADGLLRESEEQALSRADPRHDYAEPRCTHPRPGHPLRHAATGLSRGWSLVFRTTLPV